MKSKKYSLYLTLGLIIIAAVTIIMSINSTYSYLNAKQMIMQKMTKQSKTTILALKTNIANLMSSYAINEYDKLIHNEILRRDIFAIVVEDYNMGAILGQKSFVSGKIKEFKTGKVIDFNPTDLNHKNLLQTTLYSDKYNITTPTKEVLGTISIYISDELLTTELNEIIYKNILNTIFISILLIITLFISIRLFILRPVADIIETIGQSDSDGIPYNLMPNQGFTEIAHLSNSINKMINSIKRSRIILKNSENRLEYLLQLSPIAVRIAKRRGKDVIFANHAYSRLLRLGDTEVIHKNPRDYYAHQDVYDKIISRLDNDESIYNTLVELNIEGETIWALASYMNIEFDGEKAVIGWFYDVTKEKLNEARLFDALELQNRVFDSTGYMIIRTDTKGIIKQVNKAVEQTLGYKSYELVDKHTPEVIHLNEETIQRSKEFSKEVNTELEPGFDVFVAKSQQGLPNIHEWTYITKSGQHIPVLLEVTTLRNKDNKIIGYLGLAKDITQNKLMESQTKLASMGEMIGNIAHQWRQPLSVISTIASGIKVKSEFSQLNLDDVISDMDIISEQTQYLSKTIDDFRNFIKDNKEEENISISQSVEKALTLLTSSLKNHDINVILDLYHDININGYQNQLIQALINIINNAKDAMDETVNKTTDNRYLFISTQKVDDGLILSIKDNGGGIPDNVINNIFEPYFTTKHQSVGTGLGLSMAYQILTQHHNADITVKNDTYTYNEKEYKGALFEINFKN